MDEPAQHTDYRDDEEEFGNAPGDEEDAGNHFGGV